MRTVNDACAITMYELGKVVLKLLQAHKLMDSALASHLSLYAEAMSAPSPRPSPPNCFLDPSSEGPEGIPPLSGNDSAAFSGQ